MMHNTYGKLAAVLAITGWLIGIVNADSAALREKLAQNVEIELTDVTIAEALNRIGAQAGVQIELSDEAAWKLPAGRQTRLSVTLEGRLAEGLEQMLNEFFLRYAIGSESVVVYPRPELRHILGRPTPRLLKLLRNIYTNPMWISGEGGSQTYTQAAINQLAGEPVALLPLNEFENVVRILVFIGARGLSSKNDVVSTAPRTPTTLAAILDETVDGTSKVWFISAPEFPNQPAEIRIVQRLDYGKALFGQIVDVSLQDEEGMTVLRKLTSMANIDLEIVGEDRPWVDKGWLHRTITLDVLNVTVREALNRVTQALGGQVGSVNYERGSYEVVGPPARSFEDTTFGMATQPAAPEDSSGDDYVGKISIPMGEGEHRYFIEFMLRERDLPEELRRLRTEKIKEVIESFNIARQSSAEITSESGN